MPDTSRRTSRDSIRLTPGAGSLICRRAVAGTYLRFTWVLILLAAGLSACATSSDSQKESKESLLRILYESGDAVGIIQEFQYFSGGEIRLLGANQRRYAWQLERSVAAELEGRLRDEAVVRSLRGFGSSRRYPGCLVTETLEIQLGTTVRKARIDALPEPLFELTAFIESVLASKLRPNYQISIVERITTGDCAGGRSD